MRPMTPTPNRYTSYELVRHHTTGSIAQGTKERPRAGQESVAPRHQGDDAFAQRHCVQWSSVRGPTFRPRQPLDYTQPPCRACVAEQFRLQIAERKEPAVRQAQQYRALDAGRGANSSTRASPAAFTKISKDCSRNPEPVSSDRGMRRPTNRAFAIAYHAGRRKLRRRSPFVLAHGRGCFSMPGMSALRWRKIATL